MVYLQNPLLIIISIITFFPSLLLISLSPLLSLHYFSHYYFILYYPSSLFLFTTLLDNPFVLQRTKLRIRQSFSKCSPWFCFSSWVPFIYLFLVPQFIPQMLHGQTLQLPTRYKPLPTPKPLSVVKISLPQALKMSQYQQTILSSCHRPLRITEMINSALDLVVELAKLLLTHHLTMTLLPSPRTSTMSQSHGVANVIREILVCAWRRT